MELNRTGKSANEPLAVVAEELDGPQTSIASSNKESPKNPLDFPNVPDRWKKVNNVHRIAFQLQNMSIKSQALVSPPEDSIRERSLTERSLFMERTTFHGIPDFHRTNVPWARAIWGAVIATAMCAAIHGCITIAQEYASRPVVITYIIQEATSLPLPDVVICPFNRFNRTYLNTELNVSESLAQYLELSFPSPVLHSFQIRRFNRLLSRLDELELQLSQLLERIGNISFGQFIKQAGKCFRIPGKDQEGDGFGFGHRLIIKLPVHLYNPGVNQMLNDGVAVMLVERGQGVGHDLAFIPSGVHSIIPLSATKYEFMNDPPRILCENREKAAGFSRVWCFDYCQMERAEQLCNCSLAPSVMPRTDNICTAKQFFRCFAPEFYSGNKTALIKRCKDKCKTSCSYWHYDKAISYAPFPSEQAKFFVKDENEWESLRHTIILEVFFTSLDYKLIRHVHSTTTAGFIAQLGGQISLWIGGSIISVIQLIVYLFTGTCSLLTPRRQKHVGNEKRRKTANSGESAQQEESTN